MKKRKQTHLKDGATNPKADGTSGRKQSRQNESNNSDQHNGKEDYDELT
mgnify:CR=1 FL=1